MTEQNNHSHEEKPINWNEIFEKGKGIFEGFKKKEELNVLIAGGTGVGKSTLINAVFGKEFAKTGQGQPITQQIEKYESGDLCIYDTKGLELKDYQQNLQEIEDFFKKQPKEEVSEQVHIAWLCIAESSRRVQEGEKELYEVLNKYTQGHAMVIITKATQDKDEKGERFSDVVKQELGITEESHFQRVVALSIEDDDGNKTQLKGIKELVNKAYNLLPEAQRLAFGRKQVYDTQLQREAIKQSASLAITAYATGAAAIAATPIPFADIALLLPEQMAMIANISYIYGLKMNEENIKKITLALAGVAALGFGARLAVGSALKFVPGVGTLLGGALNASVAGVTTYTMGHAYIAYLDDNFEHLTEALTDLDSNVLAPYFKDFNITELLKKF